MCDCHLYAGDPVLNHIARTEESKKFNFRFETSDGGVGRLAISRCRIDPKSLYPNRVFPHKTRAYGFLVEEDVEPSGGPLSSTTTTNPSTDADGGVQSLVSIEVIGNETPQSPAHGSAERNHPNVDINPSGRDRPSPIVQAESADNRGDKSSRRGWGDFDWLSACGKRARKE